MGHPRGWSHQRNQKPGPPAEDYTTRYKNAVDDLVKQRWILPEDREALLRRGEQEWTEAKQ